MAIRRRIATVEFIEPRYQPGYPVEQFCGFKWHFGEIVAVYMSPGMMQVAKLTDRDVVKKTGQAEWRFYTVHAHTKRMHELAGKGLKIEHMMQASESWPRHGTIPQALEFYLSRKAP